MDFLLIAALAVAGWIIGSFVNYAADVLPETRRLTPAGCPGCGRTRGVVEFILMRACLACGRHRSIRAWAVQVLATAVVIGWWLVPEKPVGFAAGLALLTYFGVVIVIDLEHRLILHPVSLAGGVLALVVGLSRHGLVDTLLGGLAGLGIMLALYGFGFLFLKAAGRVTGRHTDEEALGFGDVALTTVLGLLLGWPGIIGNLILATLLGGAGSLVVMVILLLTRRYRAFTAIPYGPFLVVAAVLVLIQPFGVFWI